MKIGTMVRVKVHPYAGEVGEVITLPMNPTTHIYVVRLKNGRALQLHGSQFEVVTKAVSHE